MYVFDSGSTPVRRRGADERIGRGLYQFGGTKGKCWTCVCVWVAVVLVVYVGSGVGGLDHETGGGGVMSP